MTFSQDELQLLIKKVEKGQAKARKRIVVAIIIPTITAIIYLGFTIWLIDTKQNELKGIEVELTNRKQELSRVGQELSQREEQLSRSEKTLAEQNDQIRQVQQKFAQGNVVAAQEQIVNISTDFKENEINGFRAILKGDLENARRLFEAAYNAYPSYHNVYEIYRRVLTQDRVRDYNNGSSNEKQSIQREIIQEIVANYSWGMPEDLLDEMKSSLTSRAN